MIIINNYHELIQFGGFKSSQDATTTGPSPCLPVFSVVPRAPQQEMTARRKVASVSKMDFCLLTIACDV